MIDDKHIRPATQEDLTSILQLYQTVAQHSGGIIRISEEITQDYVADFLEKSITDGIILVVEDISGKKIIGEIHAYSYGIHAFRHLLGDLTIVIDPEYQKQGWGKQLFDQLLDTIQNHLPHILRLELFVREANAHTIAFYAGLGFKAEGRFEHRILNEDGSLETPIAMAWHNPSFELPVVGGANSDA